MTETLALRLFTEPQQGAFYDDLLAVARTAEDAGYDAFFRSDHYLAMGSEEGAADGLPGPTDAWITLAGLARETTRSGWARSSPRRPSACRACSRSPSRRSTP